MPGVNWLLALLAFFVWVSAFGWYFFPMIRDYVRARSRRR